MGETPCTIICSKNKVIGRAFFYLEQMLYGEKKMLFEEKFLLYEGNDVIRRE